MTPARVVPRDPKLAEPTWQDHSRIVEGPLSDDIDAAGREICGHIERAHEKTAKAFDRTGPA